MENVFSQAEATAVRYHERLEAERQAREAAAKDIVAGLGGAMVSSSAQIYLFDVSWSFFASFCIFFNLFVRHSEFFFNM